MKKILKRTTALLLALALAFTLTACGGNNEKSDLAEKIEDAAAEAESAAEDAAEEAAGSTENADGKPTCIGYWKYDDYPIYLLVADDLQWVSYDDNGNATFRGTIEVDGDAFIMNYEDGGDSERLTVTDGDKMVDQDGSTLTRLESLSFAASADDELTQTANFPGKFEAYSIKVPERMKAVPRTDLANSLDISNKSTKKGTDDFYSTMMVTFQPLVDVDKFMGKGAWLAQPCMGYLLNNTMEAFYGKYLLKSLGTSFHDRGNFYEITGYMWLDPSIYPENPQDKTIMGVMQLRYFGPTGYALIAVTVAPETTIEDYFKLNLRILNTCTYTTNWSTAPKVVPKQAGKARGKSKPAKKMPNSKKVTGSDPGDYGTAFYWTDEDGDIWYWNGYENIFQSYGSDGYIDDDGEFYENNDAGWDVDNYVEDYSDWSDPGDYADWSEPGDYAEDWSDPGDYADYSDPGDYGDYEDYGGYDDYGDDW